MNKRSACIRGDILFKIISLFADEMSKPLCNIINSVFIDAKYPEICQTSAKMLSTNENFGFLPYFSIMKLNKSGW